MRVHSEGRLYTSMACSCGQENEGGGEVQLTLREVQLTLAARLLRACACTSRDQCGSDSTLMLLAILVYNMRLILYVLEKVYIIPCISL